MATRRRASTGLRRPPPASPRSSATQALDIPLYLLGRPDGGHVGGRRRHFKAVDEIFAAEFLARDDRRGLVVEDQGLALQRVGRDATPVRRFIAVNPSPLGAVGLHEG